MELVQKIDSGSILEGPDYSILKKISYRMHELCTSARDNFNLLVNLYNELKYYKISYTFCNRFQKGPATNYTQSTQASNYYSNTLELKSNVCFLKVFGIFLLSLPATPSGK